MSFLRQIQRGLRSWLHRFEVDHDISDEVEHYLQEATEAHISRGLSPEEAARLVRLEHGSHTNVREQVRNYGWENIVASWIADVRYTVRQLRSLPLFTAVTVLTLAIGIGAVTAIFGAVNPILFRSLPYPNADRITTIIEINPDGSRNDGTFGMYRGLLERNRSFEAISVFRPWQRILTGFDQPERWNGQRVSASYFDVFGVKPFLGRTFRVEEDRLSGPKVIVLSHALWIHRFGGARDIIGRGIALEEETYVVVGVMPEEFENILAPSIDFWAPLQYDMSQERAWGHHLRTIGRLRPDVTMEQAMKEVAANARAVLKEDRPETYGDDVHVIARPLQDEVTNSVRPALLAIFGAAILVLLIACVNVINLLLVRYVQRHGEFALRSALGAGRGRLMLQMITESLLLALLGGAAGLGVAWIFIRTLAAFSPPDLPRLESIGIDRAAFLFAFCITGFIGLLFGLIPARHPGSLSPGLQQSSKRIAGSHHRTRNLLVIGEIALSVVLLVSSGLLWRSLERLFAVDAGFDPSNLVTMQVQTTGDRFEEDALNDLYFSQILESIRTVPGVAGAAFTSQLPFSGDLDEYGVHFEPTRTQPAQSYSAFRYAVSFGYVETMRIPLRRGRTFRHTDSANTPFVALISESLSKLRFSNVDPIGQRLRIGPMDGKPYTIIGVVADVKQLSLAATGSAAVYIPATQWPFPDRAMSLVIKNRTVLSAIPALREAIWSVDKNQPIVRIATMQELMDSTAADRRFALILFEVFAFAALLLAAVGIFGVLAGSVTERTREIGIRSALGATRWYLIAMVMRHALTLIGIGITIGFIAAAIATQALVAMLFKVSPLDPLTYVSVCALLAFVAIFASCIPAWRAARVEPAITLRAE